MWIQDVPGWEEAATSSGTRTLLDLSAAIAFDAFFAEVRWMVATGRVPYRAAPHDFDHNGYCLFCLRASAHLIMCDEYAESCRAFHPRQP